MTKAEFIDEVKNKRGVNLTRRDAEHLVNVVFEVLETAVRRDKKFTFPGFGTFEVRQRKARMGTDPRTQEPLRIRASRSVFFRASPRLKRGL